MTTDECPRFAFLSESVVSQNESVIDRWLKEREDGPRPWSQRLATLRAGLRERLHLLKMTLLRRLFAVAGRRVGSIVARAPMRIAAGSAASLSGVLLGAWAMLFPATPEEPPAPPASLPAISSTVSSEIAPEPFPFPAVGEKVALTPPPQPLTEEPLARLAPGRPSPFYVDPELEHAELETDDPDVDRVSPVSLPTTASQRPAVWLEGRIEEVPSPAAGYGERSFDRAPRFPQRTIPQPDRATLPRSDSGPTLVIQPR